MSPNECDLYILNLENPISSCCRQKISFKVLISRWTCWLEIFIILLILIIPKCSVNSRPASFNRSHAATKSDALVRIHSSWKLDAPPKLLPPMNCSSCRVANNLGHFSAIWVILKSSGTGPHLLKSSILAKYIPPTLKLNAAKVGGWIVEVGASRCNSLPSPSLSISHRISNFLGGSIMKMSAKLGFTLG